MYHTIVFATIARHAHDNFLQKLKKRPSRNAKRALPFLVRRGILRMSGDKIFEKISSLC